MDEFRPLILVADRDAESANRLSQELAERFGADYDVVVAKSKDEGEQILRQSRSGENPTALLVSCVEFRDLIELAPQIDPLVRIVATFSSDERREEAFEMAATDLVHDACLAVNEFRLDLGPTSHRLLEKWRALCDPTRNAAVIVGRRFSGRTHKTRQFLGLCQVSHVVVDPDSRDGRRFAGALNGTDGPLVVSPGQRWAMLRPSIRTLALAFDMTSAPRRPTYDVAVIGAGPGGMGVAMSLGVEGLSVMVLEAEVAGGQAARSSLIWNVLGHPGGVVGHDLMALALAHTRNAHAEIIAPYRVQDIVDEGAFKRIVFDGGQIFARGVVIATGVDWRRLNAPNVEGLVDAGVYYGATPDDLPDFAGQEVVITGYGNSAGQAALKLAETAAMVHLLARGDALEKRMSQYLIDDIDVNPRIQVALNTVVTGAEGSTRLAAVNVRDNASGEERRIATKHLLVFIGSETDSRWLEGLVALNERGHVLTGQQLEAEHPGSCAWAGEQTDYATSTPNVWVVGDVRAGTHPRVMGAVGQAMNASTGIQSAIGEVRRNEPEFTGGPENIRVRVEAQTEEQAKELMELTLSGDGYQLVQTDEPNVWRLCQELGRVRKKLDHIATVKLVGKKHFYLNIEAPPELFIGSPEQRRQQALDWQANIQAVLSERAGIQRQQQPHLQQPQQVKGGVSLAS